MKIAKQLNIWLLGVIFTLTQINAQVSEDFSDGDFTSNPTWYGQDSLFQVNLSGELQLNDTGAFPDNKAYLVTETGILDFSNTITWEFRMNLLFDPSSSNQGRFYLASDNADLKGSLNGYYISIGESGSSDKIKLYRQDGFSENSICICDSIYGSNPNVKIRVTRDFVGNWLIEADSVGGTTFHNEGGTTDATHVFSKYSGVVCKYTSTRDTNFVFDDIQIVGNIIIDNDPPAVASANIKDSYKIELTYNEVVTNSAESIANYSRLDLNVAPLIVINNNSTYELTFNNSFNAGDTLALKVINIEDLSSNFLNDTVYIVVPDTAIAGELIINEILFDPFTGGSDYIEIYNKSNKSIDLYNYIIADHDQGIDNHKEISKHFILAPNKYALLTEDSIATASEYFQRDVSVFIEGDLPSFPNDSATVYLLNPDSLILDKFSYNDDMHFELINDIEGVSLERISAEVSADDPFNWHSAAEAVGWGTPGLENSQNYINSPSDLMFNVETPYFSPDNDGFEDVGIFSYKLEASGYVGNAIIFDHNGRIIRKLMENELLGAEGIISWDGVAETGEKARVGIYLVYFEVFDIDGNVYAEKKTITLKTRL